MPTINETIQSDRKQLNALNADFVRGAVFVDNSFQRRSVWVPKNKVRLIETVLIGFPMPEIYLWASKPDPQTGNTTHSIVDGQQRLTAIRDFIANTFELKSNFLTNVDAPYAGKKFNQLSDEVRQSLWEYQITARTIPSHVSRDQIVSMFLRLNETDKSLNPQELRNAEFNGEFIRSAESIADHKFWSENDIFRSAQIRRMADIEFISSLLIFMRSGVEGEVTQSAINRAYDTYNEVYESKDSDRASVERVLEQLGVFFSRSEKVKKFFRSAVHLYPLFVVLYQLMQTGKLIDEMNFIARLEGFTDAYVAKDLVGGVAAYRMAATEGTQKRANRAERVRQLLAWLQN